jgi:hypothetical protein
MRFYWLLLALLSVWRITHLLAEEDGPWDLVVWLRRRQGDGFWGRLLDCFYCLSLWIAVPFAYLLGETWDQRLFHWPAISAGAILLERITRGPESPTPEYEEDEEVPNAVLRQPETDDQPEA